MITVGQRLKSWPFILCGFLLLVGLLACGKKANPVIPATVVPKGVTDLRYQIKGQSLIIAWTIPIQNTDGSPLTNLKGFKVRKGEWPTKKVCPTCPDQFQETLWVDLKGPELPDIRIESDQVQLTYTNLKPGNTYFFQVTAVNWKELESKPSSTLKVAWEIPLKPPQDVTLKDTPQGLVISWKPPAALIDGSPPEGLAGYVLERKTEKGSWQRINKEPVTETTYTDSELQQGVSYVYRLKALRSIEGHTLESEGSEEKSIVYTHTFPPPEVQDVIAVSRPKGVELRWLGIDTPTPSGYFVYRRLKTEKTFHKITPQAIPDTYFMDQRVSQGTTYIYSVSAVGPGPGFPEGPKSKEVELNYNP